jgi:hypothetical protein
MMLHEDLAELESESYSPSLATLDLRLSAQSLAR